MNKRIDISAAVEPWARNAVALYFTQVSGDMLMAATHVEFKAVEENCRYDPVLRLAPDEAQQLLDELWRAGLRPTAEGSAGQLAATERHLEDMRTLVFEPRGKASTEGQGWKHMDPNWRKHPE